MWVHTFTHILGHIFCSICIPCFLSLRAEYISECCAEMRDVCLTQLHCKHNLQVYCCAARAVQHLNLMQNYITKTHLVECRCVDLLEWESVLLHNNKRAAYLSIISVSLLSFILIHLFSYLYCTCVLWCVCIYIYSHEFTSIHLCVNSVNVSSCLALACMCASISVSVFVCPQWGVLSALSGRFTDSQETSREISHQPMVQCAVQVNHWRFSNP